ncbi:MAG: DNA-binding transcriptional regulator [Pirellulales bacterium]|nr:DNA-binding transcriptional regulator [Pirellulales bacterium]
MSRPPRIALLIGTSRAHARRLLQGIAAYVETHRPWSIYHDERPLGDSLPEWMTRWNGDGVIAWMESPKLIRKIVRLGLPTVDVFGARAVAGIPAVDSDEQAIARLAADHLLEYGFDQFAYCGFSGLHYSDARCKYFIEYLNHRNRRAVSVYRSPLRSRAADDAGKEAKGLTEEYAVARWLKLLPKPVGLMACNDTRAQQVINACTEYGICVPEEVAVVGVNNDEVLCGLCHPPLSSVETNAPKIGHEAAALLDVMLSGRRHPAEKNLVEPLGVVTRQSTAAAIADPNLALAMRFISEHACEGITVSDVVRNLPISRSTLERRFAAALGRAPSAEIRRVQVQRLKDLLVHTDLPLAGIARLTGFNHVEPMCRLFKRKIGCTPGEYRRACRISG